MTSNAKLGAVVAVSILGSVLAILAIGKASQSMKKA